MESASLPHRRRALAGSAIALVLGSSCGSSNNGASASGAGGATTAAVCQDTSLDVSGCASVLSPSANDTMTVQAALMSAAANSAVCLCPGTYRLTQPLTLGTSGITIKGVGPNIDDATLDFSGASSGGADTILVTAGNFTAENFAITNTPGNGVVVRHGAAPTFRKLHVSWDNPDPTTHGAYAVYAAQCTNVLLEYCDVSGAADAAFSVSESTGAVLRHNIAHDSVLGVELENTSDGEAYDNEAYNNAGGVAVFLLPNLTKKTSDTNLVHDNNLHDNNHANFASATSIVASLPSGTGVLVAGGDKIEIRDNVLTNNQSTGVAVVSEKLLDILAPSTTPDPEIAVFPTNVSIHDNTLTDNGAMPAGAFAILKLSTLESVLWDGWVASGMPAKNEDHFCLGSKGPWPTFRMFAADHLSTNDFTQYWSTDTTPYRCDLPALPGHAP